MNSKNINIAQKIKVKYSSLMTASERYWLSLVYKMRMIYYESKWRKLGRSTLCEQILYSQIKNAEGSNKYPNKKKPFLIYI